MADEIPRDMFERAEAARIHARKLARELNDTDRRLVGYLRRDEAAEYAGVSLSTIDRAIASGQLDSRKRGRTRLTRAAWIDAWLNGALTVCAVLVYLCALLVAFALAGHPICRHLFGHYCPFA